MRTLDDVREQLNLLDKWQSYISDANASLDLYSLEPEDELIQESKKGLENIDIIAEHKSIDGIMIGPYDLSGSLGYPGEINNPIVKQACSKIIKTCIKKNISCGTQISIPSEENINEVVINSDVVKGKGKPIVAYSKKKTDIETRA